MQGLTFVKSAWRRLNKRRWQRKAAQHISAEQERRQREASLLEVGESVIQTLRRLTPVPEAEGLPLRLLGDGQDGSYVVPTETFGATGVLSPGVGPSSSFEFEFAKRGLRCVLVDGSVSGPPVKHEQFSFVKEFVGTGDSQVTIDRVLEDHLPKGDFILQIDVEGAEYDALSARSLSDFNLRRIPWLVVELHELHRLFDPTQGVEMSSTLLRLLDFFEPIHLNCNNSAQPVTIGELVIPPVIEVTMLRRDLLLTHSTEGKGSHRSKFPPVKAAEWLPEVDWPFKAPK